MSVATHPFCDSTMPSCEWSGCDSKAAPSEEPSIGIVVPVLNEASTLEFRLQTLRNMVRSRCPVVVVDGGSTDGSSRLAQRFFHTEKTEKPNRSHQLNRGAQCLTNDVLLFLHADTELPRGFDFYIRRALSNPRVAGGCFRLQFDVSRPMLRFYSWLTRFPGRFLHFGDQGFFVRREIFWKMGGFQPFPFLEDVDFLRRLGHFGKVAILPVAVRTSARRFVRRGLVRQQLANIVLVTLFELGISVERLAPFYPQFR
jgi:rSAM/selenodomain-associated transferase 2